MQLGDLTIASQTDDAFMNTRELLSICSIRKWVVEFGCRSRIRPPQSSGTHGKKALADCKTWVRASGCSFSAWKRATSWAPRSLWRRGRNTQ